MGKIKIIIENILGELQYLFCPKDKSIVILGAWFGNRFSDNTRYLYQYLSENKEKLGLTHVVWVTRDAKIQKELTEMGYEAYMMDSEEAIQFHKCAGIHILCNSTTDNELHTADILSRYSNGAIKINLWHGLGGIKGVSFASKDYLNEKAANPIKCGLKEWLRKFKIYRVFFQLPGGWGDTYYLSTTPFETEIFKKYFCMPDRYYIESGYPRNQKNIRLRKREAEVIDKIKSSKRVILYMPTFRNDNSNYVSPLSCEAVLSMLKENGWLWIEKKHGADSKDVPDKVEESSVLQLNSDFDANVLLPYVDLIVTDYSSVSWDGLYHRKPILFYMPDYSYYMEEDRGFVLKPEEFIIGPATYSISEMVQELQKYKEDFSKMLPDNEEELFEKVWGKERDCSEIWADMKQHLHL